MKEKINSIIVVIEIKKINWFIKILMVFKVGVSLLCKCKFWLCFAKYVCVWMCETLCSYHGLALLGYIVPH